MMKITVRAFLASVIFLVFALTGQTQTKTSSDAGIDEKLGMQVAMDTVLKDENGNDVTLRQLIDKPTILIFNYFRCAGICPVLISNMVSVINRIQLDPGKDFRLIAVSFDPTDTPQMAREKKANYLNQLRRPLSPDAWHFLTGTEENTRIVADSAGFNYRRQGDMYIHPGAIIVLTPKGIISRYLYGTSFVPVDVAMAVDEAKGGRVIPTISKAIAFCFGYDPAGRGYVLNVTRLMGTVTLVLVGVFAIFFLRSKSRKKRQSS
jgi:protein SCO1/2